MEEQSTVNGQTGETVRIYRDGMPSEGAVVSMAELEAMLNDGRLTGHDLIHHDGGWRPLDSVFEIPEPPKAEHVDDAEPELALSLKQLPSVFAVGGGPVDAGFVGGISGHRAAKKGSSTTVAVVVVVVVIIVAVVVWLAMKG
jgi:hypothetical protein